MRRLLSTPCYGFSRRLPIASFFSILILLCVAVPAAADTEMAPRAYEVHSADKRCMAKSTPVNHYIDKQGRKVTVIGWDKGTTEVYVLGPDGKKIPNAKYDFFSYGMHLKCFKNASGQTSVLLVRTHGWSSGVYANDYALAFAFYLDGKLMNRYSTLDLALYPENVQASVSHYWFLQTTLGFQKSKAGEDVFQVITLDGRTVSFDLPSGRVTSHRKDTALQRALFDAVGKGNIDGIKKAIKQGADINAWYKDGYARPFGWTPLRYAFQKKRAAAARFLIDQGADLNARSFDGIYGKRTKGGGIEQSANTMSYSVFGGSESGEWVEPTPEAIKKASRESKEKTRAKDRELNLREGRTLLYDMVSANSVPYVKLLLEKGADPNGESTDGSTPLHRAANHKNLALARLLLKQGADPNRLTRYLGYAPLHEAVLARSPEMIELLADHGADPNIQGKDSVVGTPLYQAASIDQLECAKALIKKGADLYAQTDFLGYTPFHEAVATYWGDKVFLYLIKSGVNLNVRSKYLDTPLHVAVGRGKDDRVKILLEKGADVNAVNKRKMTPLLVAVDKQKWHLIKLLVEKGADVRSREGGQWTVLHEAVAARAPQWVFQYFVKQGANPNARDQKGNTPLHKAVRWDRPDELKILLKLGANPDIKNKQGQSPRSLAVGQNKRNFVKLFDEAAGAKN